MKNVNNKTLNNQRLIRNNQKVEILDLNSCSMIFHLKNKLNKFCFKKRILLQI